MAFANSAEPPGLTVLVSNPPEDLKLSLRLPGGNEAEAMRSLYREQRGWDAYYRFYYGVEMPRSLEGAVLIAQYKRALTGSLRPTMRECICGDYIQVFS